MEYDKIDREGWQYGEKTMTLLVYPDFEPGLGILEAIGFENYLTEDDFDKVQTALGVLRQVYDHVHGILRDPETGAVVSQEEDDAG